MNVRVLYFQTVRRATGLPEEEFALDSTATVGALLAMLVERHPALSAAARSLLFAVNEEHATQTTPLQDGDIVAVMPPFSGG